MKNNSQNSCHRFITYKPQEIIKFEKSILKLKEDIPPIADRLREVMDKQKDNQDYVTLRDSFLDDCKNNINPDFDYRRYQRDDNSTHPH